MLLSCFLPHCRFLVSATKFHLEPRQYFEIEIWNLSDDKLSSHSNDWKLLCAENKKLHRAICAVLCAVFPARTIATRSTARKDSTLSRSLIYDVLWHIVTWQTKTANFLPKWWHWTGKYCLHNVMIWHVNRENSCFVTSYDVKIGPMTLVVSPKSFSNFGPNLTNWTRQNERSALKG